MGTVDDQSTKIFNGDKKKFHNWRENVLMKLKPSPQNLSTEQSRMNFVNSKLNEDCQFHMHSCISERELKFPSFRFMMKLLGTPFDDPYHIRDATTKLYANSQRDKPSSTWIAEIRRDAATAGYDKYLGPL